MHTRSRNAKLRLSHKGRIKAVLTSNSFHNQLKNLNLVTSPKHFIILKVNLVLADCDLMVASFYFKAHLGQNIDDFPTSIVCQICRCQIKITALVIYFQRRIAIFIQLKEEKLWLWSEVKGFEAQLFHMLEGALEVTARIP